MSDSPSSEYPDFAGWVTISCGCCAGIEWGGFYPRECRRCGGGGYLAKHLASGAVALYPGGPFRWREKPAFGVGSPPMNVPNVIADERGVIVHDSGWPRCHSCGRPARDVASLHYRRADGVRGMSYPDCSDCREQNARRLERLGFTLTRAPREPK